MPELGFYTVREVAKMLKINVVGVYELINEGKGRLTGFRSAGRGLLRRI